MSPDSYNTKLNVVNVLVTLIIVVLPAIDWILFNHRKIELFSILFLAPVILLAISCFILSWGFKKMINVMDSKTKDVVIDKALVFWHILAFILVVIATYLQSMFLIQIKYPHKYAITTYCLQAINFACSTILAAIVNNIFTRYLKTLPNAPNDANLSSDNNSSITQSYVNTDGNSLVVESSRHFSQESIKLLVED